MEAKRANPNGLLSAHNSSISAPKILIFLSFFSSQISIFYGFLKNTPNLAMSEWVACLRALETRCRARLFPSHLYAL